LKLSIVVFLFIPETEFHLLIPFTVISAQFNDFCNSRR